MQHFLKIATDIFSVHLYLDCGSTCHQHHAFLVGMNYLSNLKKRFNVSAKNESSL